MNIFNQRIRLIPMVLLSAALLVACGGGGSSGGDEGNGSGGGSTTNPYQGTWSSTFTGGDTGVCEAIVVDAQGKASGTCTSRNIGGALVSITGSVSTTGNTEFTTGGGAASSGATFTGKLFTNGTGSGTWVNRIVSGTWTAKKK